MYLVKKTYVKNWSHMPKPQLHEITVKQGGKVREDIQSERITEIVENVGYWRKANAIHQWFVANVQNGNDNCGEYYVSREQLQNLLGLCEKVLAASKLVAGKIGNGRSYNPDTKQWEKILVDGKYIEDPSVAQQLLPAQEGFFFGSTDYDEYYIENLQDTVKILTEVLAEPETGSIHYQSSW